MKSNELLTLDAIALHTVRGGMNLEKACSSCNVEDRRPGAGTKKQQRAQTDQWNREAGCPTWAELHPNVHSKKR